MYNLRDINIMRFASGFLFQLSVLIFLLLLLLLLLIIYYYLFDFNIDILLSVRYARHVPSAFSGYLLFFHIDRCNLQ